MEMLNQKQKIMVIVFAIVVIGVIAIYYINSTKEIYNYDELDYDLENIAENREEESKENIIVHVAGEVIKNGIVEVKENARINDVVEAAGGLTDNADLSQVNLAYIVEDGQKIYIPSKEEYVEKTEEIIQADAGNAVIEEINTEKGLVNINKADLQELETLPGIGEAIAQKIMQYRQENGNFATIEDIKNVSGIGDAKFESIKDFITV